MSPEIRQQRTKHMVYSQGLGVSAVRVSLPDVEISLVGSESTKLSVFLSLGGARLLKRW